MTTKPETDMPLPCRFCQSDDVFVCECEDTAAGCSTFWVECDGCQARGSVSEYKAGALLYWNSSPAAIPAQSTPSHDWPVLIQRQMDRNNQMPMRPDEMSEREAALFKMLASHSGFLQYMRDEMVSSLPPQESFSRKATIDELAQHLYDWDGPANDWTECPMSIKTAFHNEAEHIIDRYDLI